MKPSLLFFTLPLLTFAGCATTQNNVQSVTNQLRKMVAMSGPPSVDNAYLLSLAPIHNVKGLVVADPKSPNPSDTAFGAGCARWLDLQVGGQLGLETSPPWEQLDDARRLQGLHDLRLDSKSGVTLINDLGVSHIALGTFTKGQLVFQLVDASGHNVGVPLQLHGSNAQIAAQLPQLARQMAKQLGLGQAELPAQIPLSDSDLTFIGGLPRRSSALSASDVSRLRSLAAKDSLPDLLRARLTRGGPNWAREQNALYAKAPHNAIIVADLLDADANALRPHLATIDALIASHPNNFMLAFGEERRHAQANNAALRVQACERMMRLARNPTAFFELSEALGAQADSIRRGAFYSDMSSTQRTQVGKIYPRRQAVAASGVHLFPTDAALWASLAEAATCNGDNSIAKSSLQKSVTLDPAQAKAWNWGIQQLFEPKWGGSPTELVAWCKRAAQNAGHCPGAIDATQIEAALDADDVQAGDQVEPILTTFVRNDPNNAGALRELGARYHYFDHAYRRAEKMYRRSLALNPNDSRTLGYLADITQFVHQDAKGAGQLYYRSILVAPGNGYAHANYARWLHLNGRKQAAIGEAKVAIKCGYTDATHPVWQLTGVHP
ncbi:hypothetical protein IAD21_06007 [Abditibacteriota bacterium]|nr:hypothetical protein IAD21_06007 [Abditibacteriota bacterium]